MAENFTIRQTVDLSGINPNWNAVRHDALMYPGDNLAHTWEVQVKRNGIPVDMTGGNVVGYFQRKDGNTVMVNGTIEDSICKVTMAQECYAIPGAMKAVMRYTDTSTHTIVTLAYHAFTVQNRIDDGGIIDPGEVIPSIDDLLAEIEAMEQATAAAEAAASKSVRYDSAQALTDAQKEQARENIDAASEGDITDLKSQASESTKQFKIWSFDERNDSYRTLVSDIYLNAGESLNYRVNAPSTATIKIQNSPAEAISLGVVGEYTFTADISGYLRIYYKSIFVDFYYPEYRIVSEPGSDYTKAASQPWVTNIKNNVDDNSDAITRLSGQAQKALGIIWPVFGLGGTALSSGAIIDRVYTNRIRMTDKSGIFLSTGSTIACDNECTFYLYSSADGETWTDLSLWRNNYTITNAAFYYLQMRYTDERDISDIYALSSNLVIENAGGLAYNVVQNSADIVSLDGRLTAVESTVPETLSPSAYRCTIDSVGEAYSPVFPLLYKTDEIVATKTVSTNYSGVDFFLHNFAVGSMIGVKANRDVNNGSWLIRIDFLDSEGTRVAAETSTTENKLTRVIPDDTKQIKVTLALTWNKAMDAGTTVTFNDIQIYYADIEEANGDENGNTTYVGERIELGDDTSQHKCNVSLLKMYAAEDLPTGVTTNKAFYWNQSMTIFGGYIFFFSENGGGIVADYATKAILSEFYTEPTEHQHQNSAQFSDIYYNSDDEFPLLFVSRCGNSSYQSGTYDYDEALIYRVTRADNTFTFALINSISLDVQSYGLSWGIDNIRHRLYACGPIYGNWQVTTGNKICFWVFDRPDVTAIKSGTPITLNEADAVCKYQRDYATLQGCAVHKGVLFCGVSSGMQYIWAVRPEIGTVISKVPIVSGIELEGVAIYDNMVITSHKTGSNLYLYGTQF